MRLPAVLAVLAAIGPADALGQEDLGRYIGPDDYVMACDEDAATAICREAFRPRWLARGSVIVMDRATEDSMVLMRNVDSPIQRLNASDFDFDWQVGMDVSLVKRHWDESGFEFRFLTPGQLSAGAMVLTPGSTSLELVARPPVFLPDVQSIDSRYTTKLRSFEANYHYAIDDRLTYLAGFRFVRVDDDLTAVMDAAPQSFLYQASTRNSLYGGQVGVIGTPCRPICGFLIGRGFAKIGVYGNDARHRSFLDSGVAGSPVEDSTDRITWLGEIGVTAELPLTHYMSVLGGYHMLWAHRIAVASDQMIKTDFFNGVGIDDRGGAIFHGANLGILVLL